MQLLVLRVQVLLKSLCGLVLPLLLALLVPWSLPLLTKTATIMTFKSVKVLGNQPLHYLQVKVLVDH